MTNYIEETEMKIFQGLADTSNTIFGNLMENSLYSYFRYEYKKTSKLEKLYVLPKIQKGIHDVPGKHVISRYVTPTEKI